METGMAGAAAYLMGQAGDYLSGTPVEGYDPAVDITKGNPDFMADITNAPSVDQIAPRPTDYLQGVQPYAISAKEYDARFGKPDGASNQATKTFEDLYGRSPITQGEYDYLYGGAKTVNGYDDTAELIKNLAKKVLSKAGKGGFASSVPTKQPSIMTNPMTPVQLRNYSYTPTQFMTALSSPEATTQNAPQATPNAQSSNKALTDQSLSAWLKDYLAPYHDYAGMEYLPKKKEI
jgi:hypothetical protein